MTWTNESPSQPGWYWLRNLSSENEREPKCVYIRMYARRLALGNSHLDKWGDLKSYEWAGPIPLPGLKKFAVSCTFHAIDVTDLDSTSLELVEAETAEEAAFKIIEDACLKDDENFVTRDEICPDEMRKVGMTKEDLKLSKKNMQAFLEKRRKYWRKHIEWSSGCGYDFVFNDQNGRSGGVYGIKVLEI